MRFTFTFLDAGREPQCPPNPNYPRGMDLDISGGALAACHSDVPWPAPRCGVMMAECKTCGTRIAFTVAGRPDDPRTLKLACRKETQQ